MGAYQSASQLLPKPVLAMAREFNYSKENYLILARRNKQLQKDFPQIWENIQSCAYCADGTLVHRVCPGSGGLLAG